MEEPIIYRSYLLRLWQVKEESDLTWRAMLEDVKTSEQRGFTCLEDLIVFLRQTTTGVLENEGGDKVT